jgi:cytochrome c2
MCPSRFCMIPLLVAAASYCAQQRPVGNHISPPHTPAESGEKMFKAYCASCHGVNGTGDGPEAAVLTTRPTNLSHLAKRNSGVFPSVSVTRIIEKGTTTAHGSSEMPV